MFLSAYILLLLAQPVGVAQRDQMVVTASEKSLELTWSDAEDRIQATVTPATPTEGQPFEISAHVGTFQGPEFDGPVSLTLKFNGEPAEEQTQTVRRLPGAKAWKATFTPREAGAYGVEISFRTTRLKVARAPLLISIAKLPRWPWWAMVGVLSAVALGLGVRAVFKKENT